MKAANDPGCSQEWEQDGQAKRGHLSTRKCKRHGKLTYKARYIFYNIFYDSGDDTTSTETTVNQETEASDEEEDSQ